MRLHRSRDAFTLIEVLIVVAILGILAGLVVPQFVTPYTESRESTTRAQLKVLRDQIQVFHAQNGAYPDLSSDWNALVNNNFIQSEPLNPYNQTTAISTAAGPNIGWVYGGTNGPLAGRLWATDENWNPLGL